MSVLTLVFAALSGNVLATFSSVAILGCYVLVQIVKHLPISSDYYPVICAGIWVIASGSITRRFLHSDSNVAALMYAIPVLVAMSALCYLWAGVSNAPREKGSVPYVVSDVLMVVAMLLTWWTFNAQLIDRIGNATSSIWGMGSDSSFSRSGLPDNQVCRESGKEDEALPAPKVRAHG